jgi:hypothetical protein
MSRAMVLLLLGAALPAGAQSPAERAEQALPGMPDLGGMQGAEGTVVIPFAGTEMPERNFNPNTFEDNIQTIRQTPGTQNRVLEGTEDSYLTRPGFTVTPEDLANPDAVVRDAPNIAGSYFTEETGSCENPDLPPSQPIDRFCTSREVLETRSCDQIRNIWIDRTDWYRCDVREEVFVRFCERDVTYSCVIETDTNACIRNNVTFDGGTVSWSGNEATVHFPEAPRTDTDAAIYDHMFTIRLSDRFHADAVSVRRIRAKAVVQLALGDEIVGTWAENINPDFGQYVSPFDSPFAEPGEPLWRRLPHNCPGRGICHANVSYHDAGIRQLLQYWCLLLVFLYALRVVLFCRSFGKPRCGCQRTPFLRSPRSATGRSGRAKAMGRDRRPSPDGL